MKDYGVLTARRNGLTTVEEVEFINSITEEDPEGRWGNRLTKEKLGLKGIHIPRSVNLLSLVIFGPRLNLV